MLTLSSEHPLSKEGAKAMQCSLYLSRVYLGVLYGVRDLNYQISPKELDLLLVDNGHTLFTTFPAICIFCNSLKHSSETCYHTTAAFHFPMDDQDLEIILSAISRHGRVTQLFFGSTPFSPIGISNLARFFKSYPKLKGVSFVRNSMDDEQLAKLARALFHPKSSPNLQTFACAYNLLTEKGINALCDCLFENTTLRSLYLPGNLLSPSAILSVMESLPLSMEEFVFNDCHLTFSSDQVDALADSVTYLPNMHRLDCFTRIKSKKGIFIFPGKVELKDLSKSLRLNTQMREHVYSVGWSIVLIVRALLTDKRGIRDGDDVYMASTETSRNPFLNLPLECQILILSWGIDEASSLTLEQIHHIVDWSKRKETLRSTKFELISYLNQNGCVVRRTFNAL